MSKLIKSLSFNSIKQTLIAMLAGAQQLEIPTNRYGQFSTTFTFNGSGGTTTAVAVKYVRQGNLVTLFFPPIAGTTGTGSTLLTANTNIPDTWARPSTYNISAPVSRIRDNGAGDTAVGEVVITTAGTLIFNRRPTASLAWTNASSGGVDGAFSCSYIVD